MINGFLLINKNSGITSAGIVKEIKKKLNVFKKKVKSKYEIISVFSSNDIQKIKKLLIKNAN